MTTLHCFAVPELQPEPALGVLNAFLASQRVLAMLREFIADRPRSWWVVCLEFANMFCKPRATRRALSRGGHVG